MDVISAGQHSPPSSLPPVNKSGPTPIPLVRSTSQSDRHKKYPDMLPMNTSSGHQSLPDPNESVTTRPSLGGQAAPLNQSEHWSMPSNRLQYQETSQNDQAETLTEFTEQRSLPQTMTQQFLRSHHLEGTTHYSPIQAEAPLPSPRESLRGAAARKAAEMIPAVQANNINPIGKYPYCTVRSTKISVSIHIVL